MDEPVKDEIRSILKIPATSTARSSATSASCCSPD
jgi:hypothetical protein